MHLLQQTPFLPGKFYANFTVIHVSSKAAIKI